MGGSGPAPTRAEDFLEQLTLTHRDNVKRGREKFGVPKGFDDSKASYHQANVRREYEFSKKVKVMESLECKGFDEDMTKVRDFSLYLKTGSSRDADGRFPMMAYYEKMLTNLMGKKYQLTGISGDSDKTWDGGKNPGYIERETNRLKFAPKTDPKHNELYISMETDYALNKDYSRSKITSQNLMLTGGTEWTQVADVKYAMNAVYKAVGLTGNGRF